MRRAAAIAGMLMLAGCTTDLTALQIQRAQLAEIETSAQVVNKGLLAGDYDPAKYDFYLMFNRSIFDQVLQGLAGSANTVSIDGKPVEITFTSVALNFHPGSATATIAATATDPANKLVVAIDLDARLLLTSDPAKPGALFLQPEVLRLVPRIQVNNLNVTMAAFVRKLVALKLIQLTQRLPRVALPIVQQFAMGGPGGTRPTGRIATGSNGWIEGNLTFPGSQASGKVVIEKVLVLSNGVHIFANVEGL